MNLQSRIAGILTGLAAGDKIGGPSWMAVQLAESLATANAFDPDDIFNRYMGWWNEGAFDTGEVAASVFDHVAKGWNREIAAANIHVGLDGMTAGCNPAHRVAPLAMANFLGTEVLAEHAAREASLTHHHPTAGETSAALTLLCRHLALGKNWDEARKFAAEGRVSEISSALLSPSGKDISTDGYSPDVMNAAIYFLDKSASLEEALETSTFFAGDENYCPVLVGAIGGARWGIDAVPKTRESDCPLMTRISSVSGLLVEKWEIEE